MILSGDNAALLEELYERYTRDPGSVGDDWAGFFREMENGRGAAPVRPAGAVATADRSEVGVQTLIESYRRFGHLAANLDPLGLGTRNRDLLDLSIHGLGPSDLDRTVDSGIPSVGRTTLRKLVEWLDKTYCGSIGVEHSYIRNTEERDWLEAQMEGNPGRLDLATRLRLFEKVFQAEYFEKFLAQKFVGKKRFSLEGGEAFIALLDAVIEESGRLGKKGLVIGMAHRGRLNVLVNILEKPAGVIFAEFKEKYDPKTKDYADVKYHLGYSHDRMTRANREVHLTLAFNPSHLEAVDPVVLGSVRARQDLSDDAERRSHMGVVVHGDAAFMGQGVVAVTLNLCNLEGYRVGGTLHVVVNNQIGFTTLPRESRSTEYATDLAKGFLIPILHVNGDDPEAVFRCVNIGLEYQHRFQKDVIIDLICYRRLGHNENDEPAFTQPHMYRVIKEHPTTAVVYRKHLENYDDISAEDLDFIEKGTRSGLENSFKQAEARDMRMTVDSMGGRWSDFSAEPLDSEPQTRLLAEQLERVQKALTTVPGDFHPHPKLERLIENRRKMLAGEMPIDWGLAEALAFGSILENGFNIRLSGQDARRGTFSHRHAVLTDVEDGKLWTPLQGISENQGRFEVYNSPLSEYSVLGFDYGYSLTDPRTLVIWEAQFGDFVNGAQIMIDQFISSSEVKWHRMSGLVMLLPHGYEGQGPEHSSARLERFLQQCAADNMQVCNCSTASQYFHLLRRQMLRKTRKPLIVMAPKSLLRLTEAGSTPDDLGLGIFREVLRDRATEEKRDEVKRILLCSGKVYYDLNGARKDRNDVAIGRVEQLYPYPARQIAEFVGSYPQAKQVLWVQEEPQNQGAWNYIKDRLREQLESRSLECVGRPESPSPAAGLSKVHQQELERLLEQSFG